MKTKFDAEKSMTQEAGAGFPTSLAPSIVAAEPDSFENFMQEDGAQSQISYAEQQKATLPPLKQQLKATRELLERRFSAVKSCIEFEGLSAVDGKSVFEVENGPANRIIIRGSSGVAAAMGLNWYMKHVCNQSLSWCGSRVNITPETMKKVPNGKFRQVLPHRYISYMNYCTIGYSASYWDWQRWEWEIDFMALNGVNMPLATVGLEAAWYNALTRPEIGFSDIEARRFLIGPAHMPWQWMQNLEGEGELLPKSWIDEHVQLGQQIIEREHEFGMMPIQQGFSGYVPRLFQQKFPQAKIHLQPDWFGWKGVAQIDPTDPLFSRFGRIFLEEEGKLFGLGGFYAADPFHESNPPQDIRPEQMISYLIKVGRTISEIFDSVDADAVWIMQSWSIRRDIACAVPRKKLLILDLAGGRWDKTGGFWEHEFCTGILHNFGGRNQMVGDLVAIFGNPFLKAAKRYPDNAVGAGLFMEGILQNPAYYEAVMDMWWRDSPVSAKQWLEEYALRRYGFCDSAVKQAWQLLLEGPYRCGSKESSSIVAARPALYAKKSGPNFLLQADAPICKLKALDLLLNVRDQGHDSEGYRFDVADLTRQTLSDLAYWLHLEMAKNYELRKAEDFERNAKIFYELLLDIDRVCATRSEYRLENWLERARAWGRNEEEKNYLEKDAKMLLTYWGPESGPYIFDYAWREWSGLIRDYYARRWEMFHVHIVDKLKKGESYSDPTGELWHGREPWRANEIYEKMADWEMDFVNRPGSISPSRQENEITVALELREKWTPLFQQAYGILNDATVYPELGNN